MKVKIGITGCTGSLGKFILKTYKFICFKDIRNRKDVKNWLFKNTQAIFHLKQ